MRTPSGVVVVRGASVVIPFSRGDDDGLDTSMFSSFEAVVVAAVREVDWVVVGSVGGLD
jgi:hypothetical protein